MMEERRKRFTDSYAYGRIAEGQIAQWLMRVQDWTLLPAYEIEIPSGKGPRLLTSRGRMVVPDILAMKHQGKKFLIKWYEAKHKTRFTWHRNSGNWQTGIDLRHYLDYIEVEKQTKKEVYVCFLHESDTPSESDLKYRSPATCPTGLYGQTLAHLVAHEHHRDSYNKYARDYSMVYWNEKDLEKLATLDEVRTYPVSLWKGDNAS